MILVLIGFTEDENLQNIGYQINKPRSVCSNCRRLTCHNFLSSYPLIFFDKELTVINFIQFQGQVHFWKYAQFYNKIAQFYEVHS